MNFSIQEQHPGKKAMGIAFAVLFHAALIWALIHGLGKTLIEILPADPGVTVLPPAIVKPVDPPILIEEPVFKKPPPVFVAPPEQVINMSNDGDDVIKDATVQKDIVLASNDHGTAVHSSVHVAPVVDARACDKPDYPSREIREGIEGVTVLQFLIGVDGRVMDAKIARSSGSRNLDNAALTGLGRCTFKAGTVDGKPEQSWARIQYAWKIE